MEQEREKLAEEQDLLQRAQMAIQKQKDEITVEKERFGKDKRAILMGDLKMIDYQVIFIIYILYSYTAYMFMFIYLYIYVFLYIFYILYFLLTL